MAKAFVWKSRDASPARVEVHFYSQQEWDSALEEGLRQGFFFAATTELLPAYAELQLRLVLPKGEPVETRASVVQVMPAHGMTLQIPPPQLKALLDSVAGSLQGPTQEPSAQVAVDENSEETVGSPILENALLEGDEELCEERELSLREQIRSMTVSERMRYAARAGRAGRMMLVTDHNPNVMKFLVRNPRIGKEEIHRLLKNNRVTPDILNIIAKERKWNASEDLKMLLIRHPKTPSGTVMKLIQTISERNLRALAKSNHVKDNIKRTALQKLDKLRRARGY